MPKPKKPYTMMTAAELHEATRRFDDPGYHPPAEAWTDEDRHLERLAENLTKTMKAGRPRVGLGAERLQIAMERGLRREADRCAKRQGVSRSKLISEALKLYLARVA